MDAITEIVAYLKERLSIPVKTQRPQNPPDELITIVRTGGGGDRFVENVSVNIHCWSTSDSEARKLANKVAWAMLELPDYSQNIAYVNQNSLYTNVFTDGTPRWSARYELTTNRFTKEG